MRTEYSANPGESPVLSDASLDEGMTFLEILAAQRATRSVVDSERFGHGSETWCEQPYRDILPQGDLGAGEPTDSEALGDASDGEGKHQKRPRIVGQGMIEYALVVVLIAIVVIVLLGTVGHQAQDVFSNVSRGLAT